jgi:hypothetical protein
MNAVMNFGEFLDQINDYKLFKSFFHREVNWKANCSSEIRCFGVENCLVGESM